MTRVDVIRWTPGSTLTCAAFYLGMGSVAHRILPGRPPAARIVSRFSGGAMIVLGALLLAEHLFA